MASAIQSFKLIKKIKDEKFDVDRIHHYSLLIHLGVRDCQVGIVDTETNQFVFFEDYIFSNLSSNEEQLELLKELFDSHHLLKAGFWKNVKFCIKNNKFVQVPESLFVEDAAAEYLQLNAKLDPATEDILMCRNEGCGAVTVFAIYKPLREWVTSLYPNSKVYFVHQSASLIEGVLKQSDKSASPPLYIYIDRFKIHILSTQKGKLKYYNQFPIKQFADYVKYIMLVLKAMQMDQRNSQIQLWGYIGKNSPHAIEFSRYIQNVSYGNRPDYLKFGYLFDEVQEHHFFDLYAIHLLSS